MKIVSLRTPKPFGQRSNADILIEPKKMYFLVVEGSSTEIDYFNGINSYRRELEIDELIGVIPLEREEANITDSHPIHLLNGALMKTGKVSGPEGYELLEYDKEIDEIWLIFDRDPNNFNKDQFDNVYKKCEEYGFHIGFTNPNFEFWLLLHLPDISQYDKEILLNNIKFISADEKWLDFITANRIGKEIPEEYDIVIGPVADDNVYLTVKLFETGVLNKEEALKRLKIEKLFDQILFHTEKSLGFCIFDHYEDLGGESNGEK